MISATATSTATTSTSSSTGSTRCKTMPTPPHHPITPYPTLPKCPPIHCSFQTVLFAPAMLIASACVFCLWFRSVCLLLTYLMQDWLGVKIKSHTSPLCRETTGMMASLYRDQYLEPFLTSFWCVQRNKDVTNHRLFFNRLFRLTTKMSTPRLTDHLWGEFITGGFPLQRVSKVERIFMFCRQPNTRLTGDVVPVTNHTAPLQCYGWTNLKLIISVNKTPCYMSCQSDLFG